MTARCDPAPFPSRKGQRLGVERAMLPVRPHPRRPGHARQRPAPLRRAAAWLLWLPMALCALQAAAAAAQADGPANVLVVYSQVRLLTANVQIDAGLQETLTPPAKGRDLRLFAEFLGDPEFSGPAYESQFAAFRRS